MKCTYRITAEVYNFRTNRNEIRDYVICSSAEYNAVNRFKAIVKNIPNNQYRVLKVEKMS